MTSLQPASQPNNSNSNLQKIKTAQLSPKVKEAQDVEIATIISASVEKAIFYLGLNTSVEDRTMIKYSVIDDCKKHFLGLTVHELSLAIDNGVHGLYGAVVGISPRDIYNWINAFSISSDRKDAKQELAKIESESKKPSDQEIEALRRKNALNAFETFKSSKPFTDFGNAIYNYLDAKGLIPFNTERKVYFKNKAIESLSSQLNPIQFVGNQIKMMEAKTLLAEIKADDKHAIIIAEAKKLALNAYFQELAEVETELTDLI